MAFDLPENFFNRELSWLKFNLRVLQEAVDKQSPLLERLKFVAIAGSNLDEFFMVRVAGLKQQVAQGLTRPDIAGLKPLEQLRLIAEEAHALVRLQSKYLRQLTDELAEQGLRFPAVSSLTEASREWLEQHFAQQIYPALTPLAVNASHPFPYLSNRNLNLAMLVAAPNGTERICVMRVPSLFPRLIELPKSGESRLFVFLEDVISHCCGLLFSGHRVLDVATFRVTRNADLLIDEQEAEDLLAEVERSLRQRKQGEIVRLEITRGANPTLREFLVEAAGLEEPDVYDIRGPLDPTCFFHFVELPSLDHLRHKPRPVNPPADLIGKDDIFQAMREGDILLHHPYESFDPVVNLVRRAASDPQVLAIKQTLYRVSGESPIVGALAQAAENGKQVTVLVELKARFDEQNNIQWARHLEEAGCHVIYGLVGLKTHAKVLLIIRQEEDGIKRYLHVGTGNYNDATARVYTDIGLLTANDQMGADASAFFNMLCGCSDPPHWNKFVIAPLGLRQRLTELVRREVALAEAGHPAQIIAKMNSLVDKEIVQELYAAAAAGVKIDLIVRGICVLRPGSAAAGGEKISVRSIVGRYLEHSRLFYFQNGGNAQLFLSSADWMPRNLNERVELMVPIHDEKLVARLLAMLNLQLADNCKAHVLQPSGLYHRARSGAVRVDAQVQLYEQARAAAQAPIVTLSQRLRPVLRRDSLAELPLSLPWTNSPDSL